MGMTPNTRWETTQYDFGALTIKHWEVHQGTQRNNTFTSTTSIFTWNTWFWKGPLGLKTCHANKGFNITWE